LFRHKGVVLYTITEATCLTDESKESISGRIATGKLESKVVLGSIYVTEQGITSLLSEYGIEYNRDLAKNVLYEKPVAKRQVISTIEVDGAIYHSVEHVSKTTGYAQKTLREYLRAGVISGQKIGRFWYIEDSAMPILMQRKVEFRPAEVVPKKRKRTHAKGYNVEFNTPAGREVMKYVRRLADKLNMTIKDTTITLLEMSLDDADKMARMISFAEHLQAARDGKCQTMNMVLPEISNESPVLLCCND